MAAGTLFGESHHYAPPHRGAGQVRARAALLAKLKANATLYADVPEAPASRQVLRRVARKLAKRQVTAARLQAIKDRRTRTKADPEPLVIAAPIDVQAAKRAVRDQAQRRARKAA
jgi:hypothetical protein